jgi:hypothetical protein
MMMPLKDSGRPIRVERRTPHYRGQPSTDNIINLVQPSLVARQVRAWPQEAHADLGLADDGRAVGL